MPKTIVHHPGEAPFSLFWTAEGSGPPLILVRGLGRSHRFFAPLMPHLIRHQAVEANAVATTQPMNDDTDAPLQADAR